MKTKASAHCLLVSAYPADAAPVAERISSHGLANVVIASSLHAARDAIQETKFDLALIDADLPDGDGRTLFVRSTRTRTTSFFLLGTDLSKSMVLQAIRAGARDVFERPLNANEICNRLRRTLDQRLRRRREIRRHDRLRRLSMRIIKDRRQVRRKVDLVCRDLVGAYKALAEKVTALEQSQL